MSINSKEANNLRNELNDNIKNLDIKNNENVVDKFNALVETDIEINMPVFIPSLNQVGIVLSLPNKDKNVQVSFRKETSRNRFIMIIENTYKNKDIDIDKIFEKDFSTKSKKTNSGIGLWEIRQILKKNNNLNLYTSKNDKYFSQQLEIYY